uniref:Uncharacterized protein US22 n=1 Tax=Rhesus cytomegalovirus (strain 68-1) TaxID=47929 RepID=O90352_RHCM6|nr:unknown [macacine betaherpesvirus 3]
MTLLSRSAAEAWGTYLKQRDERPEDVIRCDYGVFSLRNLVFQRCLTMLQGVYLRQYDQPCLREYIKKNSGTIIPLRNPCSWFLVLRSGIDIPQVETRSFDEYLCCKEKLEALGILGVQLRDGSDRKKIQETTCVVLLGSYGFVYVYDWDSDGLFQIGTSLKELAHHGLLTCESVYRHPQTPFSTTEPRFQVEKLLCLDPTDARGLAKTAEEFHGVNVVVKTPGRSEADPLLLLGTVEKLRQMYPFAKMRADNFSNLIKYINQRMCCRWYVLGVTGRYANFGILLTCGIILLDECGVCYVLRIDESDVFRLADNIQMLFRCGFLKLRGITRFDRGLRGEARLESECYCYHGARKQDLSWCSMVNTVTAEQLCGAYDWLTRSNRAHDKIPTSCCWGRSDLMPTGVLQENQNWCFPWSSVTVLQGPQSGAWQENDELTEKTSDGTVMFRVDRGFSPRTVKFEGESDDYTEEEEDDDNQSEETPQHQPVVIVSHETNGSVDSYDDESESSLSSDTHDPPPPDIMAIIQKEWQNEEPVTNERELLLRRARRAKHMKKWHCSLERVSIYDPLNANIHCFD